MNYIMLNDNKSSRIFLGFCYHNLFIVFFTIFFLTKNIMIYDNKPSRIYNK